MTQANELLDLPLRVGRVASRVVCEVLSPTLDVIGVIHPQGPMTVTVDTSAQIIRVLRGLTLRADDARGINMFMDRIRPSYEYEDGSRWPCGVFMFSSPSVLRGSLNTLVNATLLDQSFLLSQPITAATGLPVGSDIVAPLVRLVEEAGVLNHRIDDSSQLIGLPANWPIGTRRSAILDQLTTLLVYNRLYFDNDGWLRGRAAFAPSEDVDFVYALEGASRVKADPRPEETTNLLDAPNVYVVVCNGLGAVPVSAKAYIDPRLPHSVENRGGLEVPRIIQMQSIADGEHAQRIADAAAAQDPSQFTSVTFASLPDPRHDVYNSVRYDDDVYLESRHELQLGGSSHSHTVVKKVVDL